MCNSNFKGKIPQLWTSLHPLFPKLLSLICSQLPWLCPSWLLAQPQPPHCQSRVGTRKLQCSASTAQLQQKHWFAINTVLVQNPKHRTMHATMKKINAIPARPSITLQLTFYPMDKIKNKERTRNSVLTVFLTTKTLNSFNIIKMSKDKV